MQISKTECTKIRWFKMSYVGDYTPISVHFHGLRECSTWVPGIGFYSRHWVPGCETNVSCLARPWWDSRTWRNEPRSWFWRNEPNEQMHSRHVPICLRLWGERNYGYVWEFVCRNCALWLSVCALHFTLASPHETAWRLEWIGLSTNLGSSYIEAWDDEDINCIRSSTQLEYFEHLENFIHFKLQPAFK